MIYCVQTLRGKTDGKKCELVTSYRGDNNEVL